MPFPDGFPAITGLLVDAIGCLWIELSGAEPHGSIPWVIVNDELEPQARTTSPAGVDIRDIGIDRILGLRQDGLGIEEVVVLKLERTPSGSCSGS